MDPVRKSDLEPLEPFWNRSGTDPNMDLKDLGYFYTEAVPNESKWICTKIRSDRPSVYTGPSGTGSERIKTGPKLDLLFSDRSNFGSIPHQFQNSPV